MLPRYGLLIRAGWHPVGWMLQQAVTSLQAFGFAQWDLCIESVLFFQMGGSDTHLAWASVQLFWLTCTIDLC